MAATIQPRIPSRCPACGQPYDFRMRGKDSGQVRLAVRYRHRGGDGWIYVHRTNLDP